MTRQLRAGQRRFQRSTDGRPLSPSGRLCLRGVRHRPGLVPSFRRNERRHGAALLNGSGSSRQRYVHCAFRLRGHVPRVRTQGSLCGPAMSSVRLRPPHIRAPSELCGSAHFTDRAGQPCLPACLRESRPSLETQDACAAALE